MKLQWQRSVEYLYFNEASAFLLNKFYLIEPFLLQKFSKMDISYQSKN